MPPAAPTAGRDDGGPAAPSLDIAPDAAAWNAFVAAQPDAGHFCRHEWAGVLAGAFGHRPHYAAARRDGRIVGVLPLILVRSVLFGRSLVAGPYLNGGWPLGDPAAADLLLEHARRLASEHDARYVEIRWRDEAAVRPGWAARSHKVAMILPLAADPDAVLAGFKGKLRSQIRRPEKDGVVVERIPGDAVTARQVRDFHDVFAATMRELGTPVYPRRLLEATLAAFGPDARLVLARHGGRAIAGGVTVRGGATVEILWAAALREHSRLAANMAVYWAAIRGAALDGAQAFDFGRSTPGAGTYRFKEQWGARPRPLFWHYHVRRGAQPDVNPDSPRFRLMVAAWRRLPLGVTRLLGPPLTRHLP